MQQIYALLTKRFLIFTRRYVLAIITLILPFLIEVILCEVIPSGTSLKSSLTGSTYTYSTNNLQIENYQPYTMPYALTGSTGSFQNLLSIFYTNSNRAGITLEQISYDNISAYVLQKRKDNVLNLVSNYYTGMSFNITNSTTLSATAYYSTFAYNSPGSILNEISNLILAFLNSNNLTQSIKTYNTPISATSVSTTSTNSFIDVLPCMDTLPYSLLNLGNSIIVGLIISLLVVHVGREKGNGSKGLQLLSGTHFITYWIANYLFDLAVCIFNAAALVAMIKLVNAVKNDSTIEIYSVGIDTQIDYLLLVLIFSAFSWPILAYIWTFLFKSEVIGFVVLVIVLGIGAFLDMAWAFIQIIVEVTAATNGTSTSSSTNTFFIAFRWLLTIIFPNVTIKRAIFDLKINNNSYCISSLNTYIFSKYKTFILTIQIFELISIKYIFWKIKADYSASTPLYSTTEPGIGIFLIISVIQFIAFTIILVFIESKPRFPVFKNPKVNNNENELKSKDIIDEVIHFCTICSFVFFYFLNTLLA